MEKHNFRSMIATASLVLGLSAVGPAHADTFGGFLGIAAGAAATDVYGMTCPVGTTSVRANVNDAIAAGNQISIQVINPNGLATTATAPDGGAFSPLAILAGGAGNYLVTIHKNTAFGEGYVAVMDCFNAAVAIAGIQSVLVQNQ
ncbi:MAG: hypothetical protein HOP18_01440 [Deltaproteobacteria bacterium]|nr:hypothetical protein [Deltaproteobacteria bacterium]